MVRSACALVTRAQHLLAMEVLHVHKGILGRRLLRLRILHHALAGRGARTRWFERYSLLSARLGPVLHGVDYDIYVAAESTASLGPMLTRLFGKRSSNGLLL